VELAKAMPKIESIVRVEYYSTTAHGRVADPYDCSKQSSGGGGNDTKYCLQSRFYSCATRVHCPIPEVGGACAVEGQAKIAAFLPCAEAKTPGGLSSFANALPCAKQHGLIVDKILQCFDPSDISYTGPAVATIDAIENATNTAVPVVSYFPDVRVAGRQIHTTPTAADLIRMACAAYMGSPLPPACSSVEA